MNNYLEYKGYRGFIDYSSKDATFFGSIFGINDLISFEGSNVEEIRLAFEEAVDDYLETCKEIGKKPEKEYKGVFNVRVASETHRLAAKKAQARKISLNKLVDIALKKELKITDQ